MHGEVDPALVSRSRLKTVDARKLIPVFVGFAAIAGAFTIFDIFLVRSAERHRTETGTKLYQQGIAAREAGQRAEALELFRAAHNHSPRDPRYHVAFAQALRATGRASEAAISLERLLESRPAYGPANAEMARIEADSGDWQNAAWYYHRALYGEWPETVNLRGLRFELAALLAEQGAREELLAEVILLDAAPGTAEESRTIARLQLAAGDWARAERHYRELLQANSKDPALLTGLARAQFGAEKYLAAERTFRRAIAAGASSDAVRRELELAESINQMNPIVLRLASREKHRRAHELLATLVGVLEKCAPEAERVTAARTALGDHDRARPLDAAEADLNLFDELWSDRRNFCGESFRFPEKLTLIAAQLE